VWVFGASARPNYRAFRQTELAGPKASLFCWFSRCSGFAARLAIVSISIDFSTMDVLVCYQFG
jgi:hypothetical protein